MKITEVTARGGILGDRTYQLAAGEQYFEATDTTAWRIFYVVDGQLAEPAEIGGVFHTLAEAEAMIAKHAAAIAARDAGEPAPGNYTTKFSPLYGEGRVYDDQPGATQYDDGTGRFGVQIWDN